MSDSRRKMMGAVSVPDGWITKGKAAPMYSIVFAKPGGEMYAVPSDNNGALYPDASEGFVPIGIVAVPGKDGRYGNYTTNGVAAFCYNVQKKWRTSAIETSLPNYTQFAAAGQWGYINHYDSRYHRGYASDTCGLYNPSYYSLPGVNFPYSNGGQLHFYPYDITYGDNPIVQEIGSSYALSDFSGHDIDNKFNSETYPAFYYAKHYSTVGTNEGDWYLPTCGEAAYLTILIYVYGNRTYNYLYQKGYSVPNLGGRNIWTMTEFGSYASSYYVWYINSSTGEISMGRQTDDNYVIPFMWF